MTVFNLKNDDSKDSLANQVSEQFKLYQLEKILSLKPNLKRKRERYSYMKYTYGLMDVETVDTDDDSRFS